MTIDAPASGRSGSSCLKGCLFALVLLLLPVMLVGAYSAWYFWQGFRRDPALRAVAELVRHDGMAEAVLGEHIEITGIRADMFSLMPGWGGHGDYVVDLSGSKASGTLAVDADVRGGRVRLNAMILTGPNGERYDLMHHTLTPSEGGTTAI